MEIKMFEVRDRATYIPTMAIKFDSNTTDEEEYMLHRAGYGTRHNRDYVYLINLETGKGNYDPFKWDSRMVDAHLHIKEFFDSMESGEVVDIEFIKGESKTKKVSERFA